MLSQDSDSTPDAGFHILMRRHSDQMRTTSPEVHPISCLQIAVYIMCGGGALGIRAAEHPAAFRIPPGGPPLPYPKRRIYRATAMLVTLARDCDLDPDTLPALPMVATLATSPQVTPLLRIVQRDTGE